MTEWIHPSIIFIVGAFLLFFIRGRGQKVLLLLVPALAFLSVISISEGTYGVYSFLGKEIIFGKVDRLSLVFSYIFTIMSFIGMVYALHVDDHDQHVATLLYGGSSLGAIFAGDYFTLFVFWEIMAFASAYLIFAKREKQSVEAAFRYILIHIFGGACLLGGIILHYADTGSILFGPITHDGSLGFYLILIGFMVNAAVPPLHAWLSDAYPESTVTGTVFLSIFTTKVALYALTRAFPGTEMLVWFGTLMAIYGVIYATMENDCRRLLAYHMISQLGYMIAGVGLGTEIGINGSVAHAFTYIIYKGLLFMAAGAVIYVTGIRKLSEMGGLYKTMPITFILYMIGGFSISAFPLFSGFVSKSMVLAAASHDHRAVVTLLLTMASSGTFLSTTLKLPYHMFFGHDSHIKAKEPPINMLIGMGIAAFLCILIGVFPDLLYGLLPYPVHFEPYTGDHVTASLGILLFTALGFFLLLEKLHPKPHLTLDTDWFYRKGAVIFMVIANKFIAAADSAVSEVYRKVILRFGEWVSSLCFKFDTGVVDLIVDGIARLGARIGPRFASRNSKFDRNIIDGIVNGVANFTISLSSEMRRFQTGLVRDYALAILIGLIVLLNIFFFLL